MTLFSKTILKLGFLFLAYLTLVSVSFGQSRSTVLYETNSGLIAAPRSFFFTNILAGTNLVIYTNGNGTITIAGTVVGGGGGGSLTTNSNQFGTNIVLTIKDGALLTNVFVYGNNTNALRISSAASNIAVYVVPAAASSTGIVVKAAASQTADLLRFENSAGTRLLAIRANGGIVYDDTPISYYQANECVRWGGSFQAFSSGIAIGPSAAASSADAFIFREAAATLQLGTDAATATAQTIKAHDGSGTDKAGADLSIAGGQGTGAGVGGNVILKTATAGASGSSANSYSNRVVIGQNGGVTINPSLTNALTINSGVITSSLPAIDISQTWSNSAAGFTGFRIGITNLGSVSASSYFFDAKINGALVGRLGRNGTLGVNALELYNLSYPSDPRWFVTSPETSVGIRIANGMPLSWASGGIGSDAYSGGDTFVHRDAAATLQLGADATTATAQTIKAHDGSGTDKAGASLTLAGGKNTGGGLGGALITQTSLPGSGASQGSLGTRHYAYAGHKGLTDATLGDLFDVAVPSGKYASIDVFISIRANDGFGGWAAHTIRKNFTAYNNAGTITVGESTDTISSATDGVGTSTVTVTGAGTGSNTARISTTFTSDGWAETPTSIYARWQIWINSDDIATVTPL